MVLRISLYTAAALLLGAHFLRAANLVAVALCAAAPLIFLWKRRWVPIVLQVLVPGLQTVTFTYGMLTLFPGPDSTEIAITLGSCRDAALIGKPTGPVPPVMLLEVLAPPPHPLSAAAKHQMRQYRQARMGKFNIGFGSR